MFDQFTQQVHRQIAIALQVFDGGLTRFERSNLGLQSCNVLDLPVEAGDFRLKEGISSALAVNLRKVPRVCRCANQHADKGSRAKRRKKRLASALARSLPVREQIDKNHCRNLRKARPQEVR